MATKSRENLRPIDPDRLYPVELLREISGLGAASFRELRRQGLDIRYVSGRAFCLGRNFIEKVQQGKESKDDHH